MKYIKTFEVNKEKINFDERIGEYKGWKVIKILN